MREAPGGVSSLRRRLAHGLDRHAPGLGHDLRRAGGRLDPDLSLASLLCSRDRPADCVGAGDGGWARELARRASSVVVFEPDRARWPHLQRLGGRRLRLESVVLCDHHGRVQRRNPAGSESALELRTLDSFTLGEVSLIRIEAGALARSVLDGAAATLEASRPCVLVARSSGGAEVAAWLSARRLEPVAASDEMQAGDLLFAPVEQAELRARLAAARISRPRGTR